ncbi:hypothetical protein CANARDRAFT_185613, partial [[Candida] arabinofermentans NRRL YB-2248]
MGDSKLYTRMKPSELQADLKSHDKKLKSGIYKKTVLKKIVANMTMGNNEVLMLMKEVIAIIKEYGDSDMEIKRLGYLFITTYYQQKPKDVLSIIPILEKDFYNDKSPIIKSLALKTMSCIKLPEFINSLIPMLNDALKDKDAYVRKTAAFTVAKIYTKQQPQQTDVKIQQDYDDLLQSLNKLLYDSNMTVISAALCALNDITERTNALQLSISRNHAVDLISGLNNCNEWCQIYILNSLMSFVPQTQQDALEIIEMCIPYLQHGNSSIVLNSMKVIVYLGNYVVNLSDLLPVLPKRISGCISNLMSKPSEIQFLAMRNIILLLLNKSKLVELDVRMFFCQYDDPIYTKDTKLEIIFLLANESNIDIVLTELEEYAYEIDNQMVRKAIRAIGNLAIKIESTSNRCVSVLANLLTNPISHIVQEISIVVKDILRSYPGKFNFLLDLLVKNVKLIEEPSSKASIIWILGEYNQIIPDSVKILSEMYQSIDDECTEVKLTMLTAIMKAYVCQPQLGDCGELVIDILKKTTENTDDPDIRERGYFYWRLISSQHLKIKDIIKPKLPIIETENDRLPQDILEELELCMGTLASIYLRPLQQVFRLSKPKKLPYSPAL